MTTKTKSQEKHKMSEIDDHILKYFDIKKRLGKGAYGIVWKAIDKKTSQTLAVKKIFDAFRDETDAQRTFREIMFLRAFREHPNVIQLHNVYKATNNLDIYLSFEFMESDLHNVIKKGNILKDVHKRYIMYQLLNAIRYIHSGNVIHRDLKPSNVLIDTKCRCKLADFGLARSVSCHQMRDTIDANDCKDPVLTDYVATRWYRAPEILVSSKRYTKGIDMWSLGCILGEMVRGKPIFQGSSTINQIEKIVSALPEITDKDVLAVGAGFGTVLLNKQISTNSATATLDELLIDGTNDAINLVKRLLVLDPLARLTAAQALDHRYVEKFRHSIQETELNVDVRPPFRDDVRLSVTEYRTKLYEIVQQTEKSGMEKSTSHKKRDPRINNRSSDSIPAKLNSSEEKLKRSAYRSQERRFYGNNMYNDVANPQKVTVNNSSSKVHIITPPTSNSGAKPKTQSITNIPAEPKNQNDAKIQTVLSKTKYIIKSTVRNAKNSINKNTISSPEIHNIQRAPSRSHQTVLDKRHSIDGSYNHDLPSSTMTCSYQPTNAHGKEKRTNMLHNSFSSISRQNEKSKLSSSRVRKDSQNDYSALRRDSASSEINDSSRVNTKLESYQDVNGGINYYEKRMRRLEEQIEKHKREVKAFCSENTRYSKSITSSRQPDPVANKSKYSIVTGSSGNDKKVMQLQAKTSNGSYKKPPTRSGSNTRFEYLYAGGDDNNNRQEVHVKYDDGRSFGYK